MDHRWNQKNAQSLLGLSALIFVTACSDAAPSGQEIDESDREEAAGGASSQNQSEPEIRVAPEQLEAVEILGRRLAEARCSCSDLQLRSADHESCVAGEEVRWLDSVGASVYAGRTLLNLDADDSECLAFLESCAVQSYQEAPCVELFRGQKTLGERCLNDVECQTLHCDWREAEECFWGGRCASPGRHGDSCFSYGTQGCESGLTCQHDLCAPALQLGEPCLSGGQTPMNRGCDVGLVCVFESGTAVCGVQKAEAEPCGDDRGDFGWATVLGECGAGLTCNTTTFVCQSVEETFGDRRSLGESCVHSGETSMTCGAGMICTDKGCETYHRPGEPCAASWWCSSRICEDGICGETLDGLACD